MAASDELLGKMQGEKDKKPKGPQDPAQFHVRLIVSKLRRQQVTLGVGFGFVAFLTIVAREYGRGHPWWLTGLPIGVVGLMIALIPPSEEWEYKPWQARARQYERNQ